MNRNVAVKLSATQNARLEPRLDGPTVLVVDDEAIIGDICSRTLTHCRVTRAGNGRQALQLLDRSEFDLILTDVNMPDMDGLELLRTIKKRQPNQSVIIMTGYACQETILEALKADADDFISKPFNLLHLQTLVNKSLEKNALKEELLKLRVMDRLKTDFLGMISDKLSNPVTSISLFLQNINQNSFDLDDPTFRENLNLIHKKSDDLVSLIQSLLMYNSMVLDDSSLKKVPADLCRLTHEVIDEIQKHLDSKNLALCVDCPDGNTAVPIDQRRIRFVIRALLDNAINACADGDTIHLDLTSNAETTILTITDHGVGIPVAEQSKVFEKFYQVETTSPSSTNGFGLGLYYARLFIQMHDGTLALKSSPGCGTSATITLPQ